MLTDAAREAGIELIEWLVPTGSAPDLDGLDGLVILGASADADQEDAYPWLRPEKALIRTALERDLPTLGICLGSQLLAEAAGSVVTRLDVSEIGWRTVRAEPSGASDPVLARLGTEPLVFQWHRCTFTVPPAAELLAVNAVCPQAFRLGRAWGVQFHPEVTISIVGQWIDDDGSGPEAAAAGVDPPSLRKDTETRIGGSMQLGRELFGAFFVVAAGASENRAAPLAPRPPVAGDWSEHAAPTDR